MNAETQAAMERLKDALTSIGKYGRLRNCEDDIRTLLSAVPQWVERPTVPGKWLCVGKMFPGTKLTETTLDLAQEDLDRGAPFKTVAVYGPIPELPLPPPPETDKESK